MTKLTSGNAALPAKTSEETSSAITPKPGDVIRYEFLWPAGAEQGMDTDKERPAAVVVSRQVGDDHIVFVAPITTVDPRDDRAIRLQAGGALGLKTTSWIIPWAINHFRWMGPDVRHAPHPAGAFWRYGELSASLRNRLADAVKTEALQKRSLVITRTE